MDCAERLEALRRLKDSLPRWREDFAKLSVSLEEIGPGEFARAVKSILSASFQATKDLVDIAEALTKALEEGMNSEAKLRELRKLADELYENSDPEIAAYIGEYHDKVLRILGVTKEFVELDGYVTSGVDLEKLKLDTEGSGRTEAIQTGGMVLSVPKVSVQAYEEAISGRTIHTAKASIDWRAAVGADENLGVAEAEAVFQNALEEAFLRLAADILIKRGEGLSGIAKFHRSLQGAAPSEGGP